MIYSDYIKKNNIDSDDILIKPGYPLLPGTCFVDNGLNFNVNSKDGTGLTIVIFRKGETEPSFEIVCPKSYRVGNVFSVFVGGIDWSLYDYVFKMKGPRNEKKGLLFDEKQYILDPYANKINGMENWGQERTLLKSECIPSDFTYFADSEYKVPLNELVIYEMHIRGFTINDINNSAPGTFLGLEEKIPYLKELGVNCVEFMPIFEFDEMQNINLGLNNEPLKNYWGYSTISFFAPKSAYAKGEVISELKHLIKELHKNKIEVWLDVVFNHTAEMGNDGPSLCYRLLDNRTFYMLDENGEPYNYTGCGNTLNCNNVSVREFIIRSLRYWHTEFAIDGFRFDLASVMTRDENGNVLSNPPLIEQISNDSLLSDCRLVAEPWDAVGLYQLGNFYDHSRWFEWNGKYRDSLRSFLIGNNNSVFELQKRISGSRDLYGKEYNSSINFITCHDGFTLNDLFSYNEKHNEMNGENNRDGNNYNLSWNCGVEGSTDDKDILELRNRMIKNALVALFTSKGIPMLLMGDECGRTQKGNNNAYCQDNEISWFDWSFTEKNKDILDFTKTLLEFRKENKILFDINSEYKFHGVKLSEPDYSETSHTIAYSVTSGKSSMYVVLNMYTEILSFEMPEGNWKEVVMTGKSFYMNGCAHITPKSSAVFFKS